MIKWVKQMFYVPKYGKVSDKMLISRLTMHISIIVICLISMSLSAFAYFSSSVTSGSNVIRAAYFDVEIIVDGTSLDKDGNQFTKELAADTEHTIIITEKGTAKTGFVIVKIGEKSYYTDQLGDGDTLQFTLKLTSAQTVAFVPYWGTSSIYSQVSSIKEIDEYIADGEAVNAAAMILNSSQTDTTEPPEPTEPTEATEITDDATTIDPSENAEIVYTVKKGDNLTKIADAYGTTVERLQVYNSIEDANYIDIGWEIKIPPEDWEIPDTTESKETDHEDTVEILE